MPGILLSVHLFLKPFMHLYLNFFFSHLYSPFTYPFPALGEKQPSIVVKGMGGGKAAWLRILALNENVFTWKESL